MRLRRILVVHPTKIIRNMIKNQILSEFTDVVVLDAPFEARALDLLEVHEFAVVVGDVGLLVDKGLLKNIRALPAGAELPVIGIHGPGSASHEEELKEQGVLCCLDVPFSSLDLKQAINSACNPRSWRTSERIHLPDVIVILHAQDRDMAANLINISRGGLLCELEYDGLQLELLKTLSLTILLARPDFTLEVKQISGRLSRLDVSSWGSNGVVAVMRLAFLFTDLSDRTKGLIEQLLGMAKSLDEASGQPEKDSGK